jgi:hypothetical protein
MAWSGLNGTPGYWIIDIDSESPKRQSDIVKELDKLRTARISASPHCILPYRVDEAGRRRGFYGQDDTEVVDIGTVGQASLLYRRDHRIHRGRYVEATRRLDRPLYRYTRLSIPYPVQTKPDQTGPDTPLLVHRYRNKADDTRKEGSIRSSTSSAYPHHTDNLEPTIRQRYPRTRRQAKDVSHVS